MSGLIGRDYSIGFFQKKKMQKIFWSSLINLHGQNG